MIASSTGPSSTGPSPTVTPTGATAAGNSTASTATTAARASTSATTRLLGPLAIAAVVLTGQAMASLDSAIVNVAGPDIERGLRLTGPALQLAIYSYLLAYAVSLVAAARLGARHGYGRVFSYGLVIFTASSLACGLSATAGMLVASRGAQGVGAALLVPQVLSLLQVTFHGEARRRALSAYGLILAVGVAAGQVIGGVVAGANLFGAGWRPIFLVNVPIGLVVLALSTGRLPNAPRSARTKLDLAGAAWLGAGILTLIVPLTFGADTGWPYWCWPLLGVGAVALVAFARNEAQLARRGGQPLIDPGLLTRPGIRSNLAGIFALHASYGALLFTTALFFQHVLAESPLRSGLTFASYAAGFATASLTWGKFPAAWQRRLPQASFVVFAGAAGLLAWQASSGGWTWRATILLAVAGAAHGTGFDSLVHRTSAGIPADLTASFSGVLATVSQLAIVAGIGLGGTIYLSAAQLTDFPPIVAVLLSISAALAVAGAGVTLANTRANKVTRSARPPRPSRRTTTTAA